MKILSDEISTFRLGIQENGWPGPKCNQAIYLNIFCEISRVVSPILREVDNTIYNRFKYANAKNTTHSD